MMIRMAAALVIDTCGERGYVAVFQVDPAEPRAVSERHLGVRATQEELLPGVGAVLAEAGLTLNDVAAVAVVRGPGSFTGVRIGLATAKGLCEAGALPLVLLSRLRVLADAAGIQPVSAWLQAGRGDVYAAGFDRDGEETIGADAAHKGQVLPVNQAAASAASTPIAVLEPSLLAAPADTVLVSEESFEQALRAAAARAVVHSNWSDIALSDAMYLRATDAEMALRAKRP